MKKCTFLRCFLAAVMLTIGMGLSAQNTLTTACPGFCNPTGAGAVAGATDAFYMIVNTEANGDITFSILGVPPNTSTIFRNNGWADGIITTLTVGGDANTANKYFTRTISTDKTKITLVKQSDIPASSTIDINGILEYQTSAIGDEANLWPTINVNFQYGSTCTFVQSPLATPVISGIAADKKITFSAVPNAASYMAYVYRDAAIVYSQVVSSGDAINYTPTLTYDYTVKLQAISNDINYVNSGNSAGYTWHLVAAVIEPNPSEYCNYVIGDNNANYAYLTWQTDATTKNVVITIAGYAGDANTAFRNNGLGANLNSFKVNGGSADTYFTRVYTTGSQTYTLALKSGAAIVAEDIITYTSGTIEWKTTGNTNAYKTYTFSYHYGRDCSSLPTVSSSPAAISFSPTVGTQTFTVTGTKLTGAVTITPPRGLTVSPTTITPDGNKAINQVVTATWTGGASNGSLIKISGGGLVSAVPVLVNTSGFSNYCNKIIYLTNGSTWPAYMSISMNQAKTEMTFSIAPYNSSETTIWNRIPNIVVNGGVANALVASNVRSTDKTQITVTFTQALQNGDLVTFGNPMVWEITGPPTNTNVYIDPIQGPYTVGQTCDLVSGPTTSGPAILMKEVNIYPNPATDRISISGEVSEVSLYSLQGQLVRTIRNQNSLDVSTFAKGLYLVKVTNKLGINSTSKLEIR